MTILEKIEWALLASAVLLLIYTLIRMSGGGKQDDSAESLPGGEEGFGSVKRPQRIVDGAGIEAPYQLVWLIFGLAGAAAALMLMERFFIPSWLGVVIALLIPFSFWSVLGAVARRRANRFEEKLIDAVDLMIGVLSCGETPKEALTGVAEYGEQPVRRQFQFLKRRVDLGMSMQRALRPTVRLYDSEGLRLFSSTLAAKYAAGGDMVPVLKSLNKVLRERYRHRQRVYSQLTGAKLASLAIAASPYVIFTFYVFRKPEWIDNLFSSSMGTTLFVVAVCFQLIGFIWLNRLSRAEL
jgi:tight adherence protein B